MKDEKRKNSFCVGRNNHRRKRVSLQSGLKWTGLNSTSLKWMRSQMNVVSNRGGSRGGNWDDRLL